MVPQRQDEIGPAIEAKLRQVRERLDADARALAGEGRDAIEAVRQAVDKLTEALARAYEGNPEHDADRPDPAPHRP